MASTVNVELEQVYMVLKQVVGSATPGRIQLINSGLTKKILPNV